jgi:hypothetical protein
MRPRKIVTRAPNEADGSPAPPEASPAPTAGKATARAPKEADPPGTRSGRGQPAEDDPVLALHREMDELWAGPEIGVMTRAQAKGLVIGSVIGGLIGAVLLQPLALIHIGTWGPLSRVLVVGIVGAIAGATAGALYMGGREPEIEGEVDPIARTSPRPLLHRRGDRGQ